MAENENDEDITGRNAVLALPAWIGPAKVFVLKRAAAYRYGVFVLTSDRLVFATDDAVPLDEARAAVAAKWPRFLAGTGFWIKTPSASYAIFFRHPFPDSPAPGDKLVKAVETLENISNLSLQAALGLSGGDLTAHLSGLVFANSTVTEARATTARVQAALAE
jgi:hypothetical protein